MVKMFSERRVQGSCFGYSIVSDLAFNYLRNGDGEPMEVLEGACPEDSPGELLREGGPPLFPVMSRIYRNCRGFRIWAEELGWMQVDTRPARIIVPPATDLIRREQRIWGLPMLFCMLQRGDVPLHAAAIEIDGSALVVAAPGRFGKTTLAAAFAQAGYRVLGEDLVCLRPGKPLTVIPGPALLRLRADVGDTFRIPGAIEVARDHERVHLALRGNAGTCAPLPVAGVALLLEGDGSPKLEPVPLSEAVRDLWAVSFNLPTTEDRARCFAAVAGLASSTPVWHIKRRRRLQDLPATIECLREAVVRSSARPEPNSPQPE